ncbi:MULTISPECIES: hypothetical protein [Bacillus]|uniref:hypothetical protein n=1 Tax=Bacillus TaxID=1386 RepID=UPI00035F3008|nr:hypothetical protein [Bacillus sp. 105MF]
MKTKGKPEQYGWKLKKVNDLDFWEWYENQDNIGESLITLVQFFTKQYGTLDVKSFVAQQAMHRDLLMKDEFYRDFQHMKTLLKSNTVMNVPNVDTENTLVQPVGSSKNESVETENTSKEEAKTELKQEQPKRNLFSGVDRNNLV